MYLKKSAVKQYFNDRDKQLTEDALYAINVKVESMLQMIVNCHNGGSRRISAETVNFTLPKTTQTINKERHL